MDDKMWIKRMPDDYYNHPSFCSDIFLTQKTGDICEGWHKNRMNISEKDSLFLLAYMNQYLLEMSECLYDVAPDSHELKWIVNLDLDIFFFTMEAMSDYSCSLMIIFARSESCSRMPWIIFKY